MQIDPVFEKAFNKIYGRPCWRVSPGWGSFLTFEFGDPHLEVREPASPKGNVSERVRKQLARRHVFIHGDWHLWINCCNWKVWSKRKRIGESTVKSSIQKAADYLDGQKLVKFSITPRTKSCVFEFDLGGKLETRPYDNQGRQWMLYDSSARDVLTLRADGKYSCRPFDSSDDKWKPIQIP
jgi:hypothetical protein